MRAPINWLREYCSPELDTAQMADRLTMTGTKVEAIHRHGVDGLENFVVARVLSAEQHPDADRLSVCTVDAGEGQPRQIVCGAPNVAAGQTVAVAKPGAVMPDGTKLGKAKLRGVESDGMILAEDELAIGTDHAGILELDVDGAVPGTPLAQVLDIATDVLELEITSNRPDCLGVYGVARELHAATGAALAPEPWSEDPGALGGEAAAGGPTVAELASVAVECPDLCPRFTARAFADVEVGPSPLWLKERLSAAGQRPINNVVDITNYAMLLSGQPLHAFDLDRIAGGRLTVRRAREGEPVTTLDGQVRRLAADTVVIDDADGPTSIAGIMGGERSEVGERTTRVLMEVANWHGPSIHRASWALGLRSEASARFEKGLAPEQCMWAQALATQLMLELCGATLLPGTIDVCAPRGGRDSKSQTIELRSRRVEQILGMPVAPARQAEILTALGFGVSGADSGARAGADAVLAVRVPPQRRDDVTREADLIEEIARIDGLERLPATLPARRGAYGRLSSEQRLRRRAVDALVGRGLYEAVGWTFAAPTVHDRLRLPEDDPRRRAPTLRNPLSGDLSQLRTTLLGSLLDVAAHNTARGMPDLRLFELGRVFALPDAGQPSPGETGVAEHVSLAVLLAGRLAPATWREHEPPAADFFAAKGVLEALGEALRLDFECEQAPQPFLHPGRSAAVRCGGVEVGWVGELHPLVAQEWDIDGAAALELDLDAVLGRAARERGFLDVISYPALRQDLAVVLPSAVPAARAIELVRAAAGELLDAVEVFDVYTSEQIGADRRSLALSLSFRAGERTLTDADVVPLRERIVVALEELGGELRA
jgi:phenylalanyl-tRNA synthetase beta chain